MHPITGYDVEMAEKKQTASLHLIGKSPKLDADDIKKITSIANNPSKDTGYTRTYYSYPAKFQAQLPNQLIQLTTKEGEFVYDPYCGGGTTGLESLLLNRKSIGYDISPFAILISTVKTTKLDEKKLLDMSDKMGDIYSNPSNNILDEIDTMCLGKELSNDINCIFSNIKDSKEEEGYKNFFKLALIHTLKIVGRRDYNSTTDEEELPLFANSTVKVKNINGTFHNKVKKMIQQMMSLPSGKYKPKFVLASNHSTSISSHSIDVIITSPPYKDLDVEYGLIQIQRPEHNKSKRSNVIWNILECDPVKKDKLCGYKGNSYWENLEPTLKECRRVLKHDKFAFFWIGFKTNEDNEEFQKYSIKNGLLVENLIDVTLSNDRVASSRSTHHNRETGMLQKDYLIITRAV